MGWYYGYMKILRGIDFDKMPTGILAVGIFLLCGGVIAALAGLSLLLPNTLFDWIWVINSGAHRNFATDASRFGLMFLGLGILLGVAGYYWMQRKEWARKLTLVIVGLNIVGNLVGYMGRRSTTEVLLEGILGIALFVYLCSRPVQSYFAGVDPVPAKAPAKTKKSPKKANEVTEAA